MNETRMSYASGMGLHHTHCEQCKAETLHKGLSCVHCAQSATVTLRQAISPWTEIIARQSAMQYARTRRPKA